MSEEAELGENLENVRPDWHLEKYETVEDQAKAYNDLNKIHGERMTELDTLRKTNEELSSKFGAPEDGYANPEIEGIEWDETDPLMVGFKEFAKGKDWKQEDVSEFLEMYGSNQIGMARAEDERIQNEMAQIDNAEARIKNVEDYISANFPDHAEGLAELATSAKGLLAVEALLEKAGKAPASPSESAGMNIPSLEEITEMQMALDENGQRKMRNPEYAAKVRKLMSLHKGTGDHVVTMG